MRLSARNVLKGRIKTITEGAINNEVVIDLGNGIEVVSVITKYSSASLGLTVGKQAYAVIKASNVMIGVD